MLFRLALAQMKVVPGRKQANLEQAVAWIEEAARAEALVVLLPEALNLGWTDPSAATDADRVPDSDFCRQLCDAARRHQLYICSGLVEKHRQQVFNSALWIDPQGRPQVVCRKMNELEIAHSSYAPGDRLSVLRTPMANFGIMICADAFARGEVIGRTLGYMGADVILSPCSWAVPPEHDNRKEPYGDLWRRHYRPVARDFQMWVAGASNVGWIEAGPWQGWKCIGCSLVMGPDGEEIRQGAYGPEAEELIIVDIDPRPRPARGSGWEKFWHAGNCTAPETGEL